MQFRYVETLHTQVIKNKTLKKQKVHVVSANEYEYALQFAQTCVCFGVFGFIGDWVYILPSHLNSYQVECKRMLFTTEREK